MINLKKERIEIPIYFCNMKIDEEGIRDEFEENLRDILRKEKSILKRFNGK
jgi:GTPase SAR1 family protein